MSKEGTLVLTRKTSEEIVFEIPPSNEATTFKISVGETTGHQTRIICIAPQSVSIVRGELVKNGVRAHD